MNGQAVSLAEIPFDALVTFFVLLVGLPAVGLQSLPTEIRQVLEKRWTLLAAAFGVPLGIAALVATACVLIHRNAIWPDGPVWSMGLGTLALICVVTVFVIPRR